MDTNEPIIQPFEAYTQRQREANTAIAHEIAALFKRDYMACRENFGIDTIVYLKDPNKRFHDEVPANFELGINRTTKRNHPMSIAAEKAIQLGMNLPLYDMQIVPFNTRFQIAPIAPNGLENIFIGSNKHVYTTSVFYCFNTDGQALRLTFVYDETMNSDEDYEDIEEVLVNVIGIPADLINQVHVREDFIPPKIRRFDFHLQEIAACNDLDIELASIYLEKAKTGELTAPLSKQSRK